jgi:Mrp family chromosome partitioning ATPase
MSKDFEILQQLEQDRKNSRRLSTPQKKEAPPAYDSADLKNLFLDDPALDPIVSAKAASSEIGSRSRQEIAKLVRQLLLLTSEARFAVMFATVEPSNSAVRITALVSEMLAQQPKTRVCAVDASFRAPALHEQFDASNRRGLADALIENGPIRTYTQRVSQNLWLLCSGEPASEADGGLNPNLETIKSRMLELRENFDYVLIGATDIESSPEAMLLAQASDGVVLVLEANITPRYQAEKTKQSLRAANVPLLGAVLNKRDFPVPDAIYRKL